MRDWLSDEGGLCILKSWSKDLVENGLRVQEISANFGGIRLFKWKYESEGGAVYDF